MAKKKLFARFFKFGTNNPIRFFRTIVVTLLGILFVSYFAGFFTFKNPFDNKFSDTLITPIPVNLVPLDQVTFSPSITSIPIKYPPEWGEYCKKSSSNSVSTIPIGWKSYRDNKYGYLLFYPPNWILNENKSHEGNSQVILKSSTSQKSRFSLRELPELYITLDSPYSTSSAVCANQYCENNYILPIPINNYICNINIIKGSIDYKQLGNKQFDFYSGYLPLPESKIILEGYPYTLYGYFSYRTKEEGEEIVKILSTLKY